ncbi:hypothetical protein HAX54_049890 [Datura stramonium]|uniref:Uncharacterized protein n=1 Tax=Datura stramonium TaxID=4076 RepID=A0ABS8WKU3_DATST|nr:hypothetical protein [Datura stramonium]
MPVSSPNFSPFVNAANHLTSSYLGPQYGGKIAQGMPPGLPLHNQIPSQWLKQSTLYPGEQSSLTSNMMLQQSHRQNGFTPPHGAASNPQQPGQHPLHSPYGHLPGLQSQLLNHHMSPPSQMMNNFDMLGLADLRDQKAKLMLRGRQGLHYFLTSFDVDALGRVAFFIRRPRPLLEVDPPKSSASGCIEQKMSEKPLEQEPMLAARVTIEDGLCLLLDVDDI